MGSATVHLGIILAILAACASATAAILESIGAHRMPPLTGVDPRLLVRLVRTPPYLAGLVLDACALGLGFTALRTVPLFVVQAIGAANLAIVAALSVLVLSNRIGKRGWLAVLAVVAGVALLVLSARPSHSTHLSQVGAWALLASTLLMAGIGSASGRMPRGAVLPGLLAGLAWGASAVAQRVVGPLPFSVRAVVTNPLTYALLLGSLLGTLLYAMALQRGSVTVASAMTTVGQTLAPAAIGWLLLGDHFQTGMGIVAALGFALTVTGAVGLAPHAHPLHLRHGHHDGHQVPAARPEAADRPDPVREAAPAGAWHRGSGAAGTDDRGARG